MPPFALRDFAVATLDYVVAHPLAQVAFFLTAVLVLWQLLEVVRREARYRAVRAEMRRRGPTNENR